MNVSIFVRFPHLIGVGTIVALVCGLYLPFLGNPPVFDDQFLFSGQRFLYYATHPFGLELRVPPLFSFAVVQVLSGHMETHRILSLAFHIACSLALYKLLYDLLRAVRRPSRFIRWRCTERVTSSSEPLFLPPCFRSFRSSCSCGGWSAAGTQTRS